MRFRVLTLVLPVVLVVGIVLLRDSAEPHAEKIDGAKIYRQRCAPCHLDNGTGIAGQFPPLAGSAWTIGDSERVVRIVLHGMTGKVTFKGVAYDGLMPGWYDKLTSKEIAAVVTYVRSAWGNKGAPVSVRTVEDVRKKFSKRLEPWQAGELKR